MQATSSADERPADPPSVLASLVAGEFDWSRYLLFPQSGADDERGPVIAEEIISLVQGIADSENLDKTGVLPAEMIEALRARGYFRLRNERAAGGFGLSDYAAFRVFQQVARWSVAVGQFLAIQNAVGAAALVRALPDGPLRSFVLRRVADGVLSGFAGTEPGGANNAWPATTATLSADGSEYLLSGAKLFAGCGDVAELLALTVTVQLPGEERRVGVAFVDTSSAGLTVSSHQFMGSRGLPNGAIRLDTVRIPREHIFLGEPGQPRFPASVVPVALLSAIHFNAAPALAVAAESLRWSREFVARRAINDRPLGDYQQVQYLVACSLADCYAIDSVVRWALLSDMPAWRWLELSLVKNICTTTAWRVVDRTVSLLGGEGLETAAGKRSRGVAAAPVERLFRDARGLRVSGNVDFLLDIHAGLTVLSQFSARSAHPAAVPSSANAGSLDAVKPELREHARAVTEGARELARTCEELTASFPGPAALAGQQHAIGLVGQAAGELLTMTAVVSRAISEGDAGGLARWHCTRAAEQVAALLRQLRAELSGPDETDGSAPDFPQIAGSWIGSGSLSFLDH